MTEEPESDLVGYVIFDDEGDIVHGNDWDPFGLPDLSVLVGDAIETAREWIKSNPQERFTLVPVHTFDLAEDGPAYGCVLVSEIAPKAPSMAGP